MTISTFIKGPDARKLLDAFLPQRFSKMDAPCRVPARAGIPQLMGTAFDYAARVELNRVCPHARSQRWVAEEAIRFVRFNQPQEPRLPEMSAIVHAARGFAAAYVRMSYPTSRDRQILGAHSLRLARIDAVYRSGRVHENVLDEPTRDQANEVAEMLDLMPVERLMHPSCVLLNPTFGECSLAVGGADADLISGNRLIDFKTQKSASIARADVRQLAAYLLLARLASDEGVKLPTLGSMEIYFARYGTFLAFPVSRLVSVPEFSSSEARFRELMKEQAEARLVVRQTVVAQLRRVARARDARAVAEVVRGWRTGSR